MLEFLLALLTTATVGVLLVPLLRTRAGARPSRSTASSRSIATSSPRSSASAPPARSPRPKPPPRALEIERRILAAADSGQDRRRARRRRRCTASCRRRLRSLIPLLALGLYLQIGHPGLPAAPFVAGAQPPADAAARHRRAWSPPRARASPQQPDDPDALSALGEALTLEADGTVTPAAVEPSTRRSPAARRSARALLSRPARGADAATAARRSSAGSDLEAQEPARRALSADAARRDRARRQGAPACRRTTMPQPRREQQRGDGGAHARAAPAGDPRHGRGPGRAPEGRTRRIAAAGCGSPTPGRCWARTPRRPTPTPRPMRSAPVEPRLLADWAEAHVRGLEPGERAVARRPWRCSSGWRRPSRATALALFYLGAASLRRRRQDGRRAALEDAAGATARRRADPRACWRSESRRQTPTEATATDLYFSERLAKICVQPLWMATMPLSRCAHCHFPPSTHLLGSDKEGPHGASRPRLGGRHGRARSVRVPVRTSRRVGQAGSPADRYRRFRSA